MQDNIVTIPAGARFLDILARELEDRFGDKLADALILLPTRRAVRELSDIFIGETGARILPRMRPLADIDPDEPPFEPGYLTGLVKPSMPGAQRRFELAHLVGQMHKAKGDLLDPSARLALADPLIAILDDAAMEEVGLSNMAELEDIRALAARHFEDAAKFYEIIQLNWPRHLAKQNVMEAMGRRVALLNALTELWDNRPPDHPVIIAGSTGTLAATARLMGCVSQMTDGLIVLPGLDVNMPDKAWDAVLLKDQPEKDGSITQAASEHPQFALKRLIASLGVERQNVPSLGLDKVGENPRLALISEALVPAASTADWLERISQLTQGAKQGDFFNEALAGLSIIEARTDDEEALAIALLMRETVETGTETAALVTPDPSLARRVKARMRRWNIDVDYSQGEPLEETARGAYLSAVLALSQAPQNSLEMAALFKLPLAACGEAEGEVRRHWMSLERRKFRRDIDDINRGLADEKLVKWLALLAPLTSMDRANGPEWARRLTEAAEALAQTDDISGAARLWREDAGEKAASLIEDLMTHGASLGDMTLPEFARLFGTLMRGKVVRPRFGTHPRLLILGPLEARMLTADTIILGGLNEGVWPARPPHKPFLSRGMRKQLGLSLPERRLGLAAHDFQQLASNPRVVLTRAQRSEDGPRVASRWLWRLQTLVRGALGDKADKALAPERPYQKWAQSLDYVAPDDVVSATAPAPRPDPDKRWPGKRGRKLSVTRIKVWIRDPYSIYGQYVLGLNPLGELGYVAGPREYGNALHKGIENFVKTYGKTIPNKAEEKLATELRNSFLSHGFESIYLARENVRLDRVATDLIALWRERGMDRAERVWSEVKGSWTLSDVNFTLTGQPDLIEKQMGGYTIFDYKTGMFATTKEIVAGFDPQLPLLAAMTEAGAFDKVPKGPVEDLQYVRIKGSGEGEVRAKSIVKPHDKNGLSAEDYTASSVDDLKKLIIAFDDKDTAYYSQPRIKFKNDYGDYDLLARRGEWARMGEEGGGDGEY